MTGLLWDHVIGGQRFVQLQLEDSHVRFSFGFISTLEKENS